MRSNFASGLDVASLLNKQQEIERRVLRGEISLSQMDTGPHQMRIRSNTEKMCVDTPSDVNPSEDQRKLRKKRTTGETLSEEAMTPSRWLPCHRCQYII